MIVQSLKMPNPSMLKAAMWMHVSSEKLTFFSRRGEEQEVTDLMVLSSEPFIIMAYPTISTSPSLSGTAFQDKLTVLPSELKAEMLEGASDGTAS